GSNPPQTRRSKGQAGRGFRSLWRRSPLYRSTRKRSSNSISTTAISPRRRGCPPIIASPPLASSPHSSAPSRRWCIVLSLEPRFDRVARWRLRLDQIDPHHQHGCLDGGLALLAASLRISRSGAGGLAPIDDFQGY